VASTQAVVADRGDAISRRLPLAFPRGGVAVGDAIERRNTSPASAAPVYIRPIIARANPFSPRSVKKVERLPVAVAVLMLIAVLFSDLLKYLHRRSDPPSCPWGQSPGERSRVVIDAAGRWSARRAALAGWPRGGDAGAR